MAFAHNIDLTLISVMLNSTEYPAEALANLATAFAHNVPSTRVNHVGRYDHRSFTGEAEKRNLVYVDLGTSITEV